MSWQHKYVEANAVRLHYVTQGQGKLLVLLHGLFEFWYSWRYQLPYLSRHFKVVVPDLRGYNDSEKPHSGYDLETLSCDIRALIHDLGYEKAHVVGHDWGGTIAWHLAHRFPSNVDRLAIFSSPQRWQTVLSHRLSHSWDYLQQNWHLLALQTPGLPQWFIQENLSSLLTYLFHQQAVRKSSFTRANTELYQAALQKPGVIPAVLQHVRHCFNLNALFSGWTAASRGTLGAPTLVMWGEDDGLLPRVNTFSQSLQSQHLVKRAIPDCGHWIQQEAPNIVNRELLEFLA